MNITIFLRKIRVALTPRNWLLKAKLANGTLVCGKNRPGYGGRGIYVYRDSIEPEFQHLEDFLNSSGVFIDIGANTGIYSLKAAKHYSQNAGTVISIEPFPDVLATLYFNIHLNGFNNVRLRNFCAGEKTQANTLWMNYNKPHSFGLLKRDPMASGLSTLTVALDDLIAWENLNRLDYIKIDAEGAEQLILSGARQVITKYRPIIQMEINISDVAVELKDYTVFQSPGSPNKIWIPNESEKLQVAQKLGWERVLV